MTAARACVALVLAAALLMPDVALAQKKRRKKPPVEETETDGDAEAAPAKPSPKPGGERPFASAGYLNVPEGHDVRMGDPSGGLAIVAKGGSLIKRQNKALVLDRGRMGVSMKAGGKAAVRVGAGTLVIETAGGMFVVDRSGTGTKLAVLDGKVAVNGAGEPRALSAYQQLEVTAGGKVTTTSMPSAQRTESMHWIESR